MKFYQLFILIIALKIQSAALILIAWYSGKWLNASIYTWNIDWLVFTMVAACIVVFYNFYIIIKKIVKIFNSQY